MHPLNVFAVGTVPATVAWLAVMPRSLAAAEDPAPSDAT